ncbi:SAM-dependent methyltransferase, partial [Leptospira interrogans]|uniref:SAM-dependent methyltransferase n=1 Tax=Leptospira interrogans TaxID=173 RepID=UPI0002BBB893
MKVYIIGAGPGDPQLITIKGAKLIEACPIVLYTGSLVPKAVIERTKKDAIVLDSSSMTLDEIISVILSAKENDQDVARVHTGDPSIFGSIAEQIRKLDSLNIQYEIVPGVS